MAASTISIKSSTIQNASKYISILLSDTSQFNHYDTEFKLKT